MAVIVDGVKKDEMPTTPQGENGQYYQVDVSCTSSKTQGLWDYNAWRLNLDYIESNSKCNLTFTSSMSKEEYDEYIQTGVALRRNTYRGKDITELLKSGELYTQISNGTFADIYVGDYIISPTSKATNNKDVNGNTIKWLIVDLDNYLGEGGTKKITSHHATIIPDGSLTKSFMNSKNTTEGGYIGSEMYKTVLPEVLENYIIPDFSNHIITYQNILSNSVDSTKMNMFNLTSGASNDWEWVDRQLDLMSEVNVYGSIIASSSPYDIGLDNKQYAIFRLDSKLINHNTIGQYSNYWLKGIASSILFTASYDGTDKFYGFAGGNLKIGVRPRFLID